MSKKFDKLLEAATDSTLLEPNWDSILVCVDYVRGGEVPGKAAMGALRKRIQHENPHVVMHSLLVLDACVKNCGHKIHVEVATREFMEEFKNLGIESKYEDVKNKVLEMLQCWAMAFANKTDYKIVVDTHNLMKLAGFDFPSIKEADAMFFAQVAPDWQDGNECFRCRTEFGILTRKHHCRACGQIFCDRCSSREMTLPQFGIEKEVRVCDACFEKTARPPPGSEKHSTKSKGDVKVISSEVTQAEKDKILREKEAEDLELALAISKSEAEAKEQDRQKNLFSIYNGESNAANPSNDAVSISSYQPSEVGYKGVASLVPESPSENSLAGDDPLARYLNRDYWQQRKNVVQSKVEEWAGGTGASAPLPSESSIPSGPGTVIDEPISNLTLEALPNPSVPVGMAHDLNNQTEATLRWCQELKDQVGVMESRIRSNTARGRPVVNDTAIQGLFLRLTEFHSQVLSRMGALDEDRSASEGLQDHLAHISDARSAVNELREESERRRQERLAEEQRQRQTQMKQTLDLMRMKKHTMLMEQRDAALQRFQQQEQDMQARRQPFQYAPTGFVPPTHGGYSHQQGVYPPGNYYPGPQTYSQHQSVYQQPQYPNEYNTPSGVVPQQAHAQQSQAVPQSHPPYAQQQGSQPTNSSPYGQQQQQYYTGLNQPPIPGQSQSQQPISSSAQHSNVGPGAAVSPPQAQYSSSQTAVNTAYDANVQAPSQIVPEASLISFD